MNSLARGISVCPRLGCGILWYSILRCRGAWIVGYLTVVGVLAGCSTGKVLLPRGANVPLAKIAVVLDEAPVGTRPEKIEAVREAVEQALQSRGFAVLSRDLAATVCKESERCENRPLIKKFNLDGVGHLSLSSVSTNNFLVGYVGSIGGTLTFESADGAILEQVKHRESENSGVLGNSGQIIGAISSQADAFSGTSFAALANAFGRKLVSQLAMPEDRSAEAAPVAIGDVTVSQVDGVLSVCVLGTPGAVVALETQKAERFSLREGDVGTYCGAFRFFPPGPVTVRLTNPFGAGQQRIITPIADCPKLDRSPVLKSVGGQSFTVTAASNKMLSCDQFNNELFVSNSHSGPFTKVAQMRGGAWKADAAELAKIKGAGGATVYSFLQTPVRIPEVPVVKELGKDEK